MFSNCTSLSGIVNVNNLINANINGIITSFVTLNAFKNCINIKNYDHDVIYGTTIISAIPDSWKVNET